MTTLDALPFPPSSLSGHNEHHWRFKAAVIKKHRRDACIVAKAARPVVPETGDIAIAVHFHPPHNRGDRVNYPNRMKPYFDGIADALGVNDARFIPSYFFYAPDPANPRVVVVIGGDE